MRSRPALIAILSVLLWTSSRAAAQNAEPAPPDSEPGAEPEAADQPGAEAKEEDPEAAAPKPKPKARLPGDDVEEREPEPVPIPEAPDRRTGHVLLAPFIGLVIPFGDLQSGLAQTSVLGTGAAFGVDLALGVSRQVMLGVWGQLLKPGEGDDCTSCSATSLGAGAFVRYHLVQGVRFDPWMSLGAGFRNTQIEGPAGDETYSGIEFLRLQVGGDWYPTSVVGFGPFGELDAGVYTKRPDTSIDTATHLHFLTGLRLTLDLPGR
jgi:hypothetical protein